MRVLIVIHIGLPEAGSASIQNFLSINEEALRALSIDYPKIGRGDRKNHQNFSNELKGEETFDPGIGTLEEFYIHSCSDPCQSRVISAEEFETFESIHIEELKRILRGVGNKFRVVMMIRDTLELIRFNYANENINGSNTYDFDTFFENRINESGLRFFNATNKWANIFQWKRLAVRFISEQHLANGDPVDDFLIAAGLDVRHPEVHGLPRPGAVNSAGGWKTLEAVRALHADRHGLRREHPLVEFLTGARGPRDASMPYDARMIEAAAMNVGERLGWIQDRRLYLTRAQAERSLELDRASVSAMNDHLPEKLPPPLDLEARGFVEREFLPDVERIAASELRDFYDQLGAMIVEEGGILKRAGEAPRPAPDLASPHPQPEDPSGELPVSEPPTVKPAVVRRIGKLVKTMLAENRREDAVRHAMGAAGVLLETPTDAVRFALREKVFKQFANHGDAYQGKDFESVDYGVYELAADLPLFRGPPVRRKTLERGDYFCVLGAAQTFGRLVRDPWARLLSEAIDLPVLNLGRGGVGPEFYLDPRLIQYARDARFVVLQMMSGRSVGCDDYPGGRRITRDGKATNVKRRDVLESLWNKDPAIALGYVRRWNDNYFKLYSQLRGLIDRPTLLLWISDRSPNAWSPETLLTQLNWGSFPQLVGEDLYRQVAELYEERFELVVESSSEQPLSRITGKPCPYFGDAGKELHEAFHYYPSSASHALLAEALTPWARGVLARTDGDQAQNV